jgi:[protein-PII] uridylyltransferase
MAEEALVTASRLSDLESGLVETCSDYLVSHTAALKEAVRGGQRGLAVAARYAQMFDGLLGSLVCAARAVKLRHPDLGRIALVAVGGYGRRLVAPHSDVDVLFLADNPGDERIASLAECVLYPLWDAGVQIGHAVRGVEETLDLSKSDIRTSTTLLDLRHVAGDKSLVHELTERGRREIFETDLEAFLSALEADITSRHERYGGTLFLREPELKLGRGGLRDLDVVSWVARARWGVPRLEDLVGQGFLSREEWNDLVVAQEHLWIVRNHLHVLTRRRHDRLTFEDQENVAALLGYRDGARLGVEQFMQTHYRAARAIARVVDRMPERARRSRRKPPVTVREVAKNVLLHDQQITMRPGVLPNDPALALRFYNAVADHNYPPDPIARDLIAEQTVRRDFCNALLRDNEAKRLFCELLTHAATPPLRRGSLLEELHEVGLLSAFVPEFEAITGRVPHDAYQAYTADVHAVLAVDRLRAIARGEFATEFPVATRCAVELPRPLPLYAAALFFNLAAGQPEGAAAHAATIAGRVCARLGMSAVDCQHVQWLVKNQDMLYHWALRRDISDPETLTEIVREVRTVDRLRDLYLLSFCIVSTANPVSMTAWNARMLAELWLSVSGVIDNSQDRSDYAASLREQVLALSAGNVQAERLDMFLEDLPERYLLGNSPADIVSHERFSHERADKKVSVLVSSLVEDDQAAAAIGGRPLKLAVITDDRPGLLADLTAALALCRYEVVTAQLYTRKRKGKPDEAFDIFDVRQLDTGIDTVVDPAPLTKLIEQLVNGEASAEELLSRRAKAPSWAKTGPRIKTEIGVDNQASTSCTVVEVYTRDRPELLYTIARTLHAHGLTITLAKVNTEGRRVADVFYVLAANGGKLAPGQLAQLSDALRGTINKLDG